MKGCLARASGGAVLIAVFGLLAVLIWRQPTDPGDPEPSPIGVDFAEAWQAGRLDDVSYDPSSPPALDDGNSRKIAAEARRIVEDLSEDDEDHPVTVVAVGNPRQITQPEADLRPGDLMQALVVSWQLGHDRTWTYRTEVAIRETDDQPRVLWRPSAIHPALTEGLRLTTRRLRANRAPILAADARPLATGAADRLVGAVATATDDLVATNPDRVVAGDVVGTSGLNLMYDAQLAGTAGLEVGSVPMRESTPVQPLVRQLFVFPPVPGKPLRLSLDPGWQQRADAAARAAKVPVGVIALDAMTGRILAAASAGGDGRDLALQGRYPGGGALRLVTTLASVRAGQFSGSGLDLSTAGRTGLDTLALDCRPYDVEGQRFTNPATAPQTSPVPLGTGIARECVTGLGRLAASLPAEALPDAATSLGIGLPSDTGTQAYDGVVPRPRTTLEQVQNAVGEGTVLVSPLAMARASATVATGVAHPPTLVGDRPAATPDPQAQLASSELAVLTSLMRDSVSLDESLAPLRSASSGAVSAFGGTAGYGPAATAPAYGWCTGYQGSVAFAVLVAGGTSGQADPGLARRAADVVAALLG
ncbi:MAG: hypothetical protein IPJ14_21745 [Kineosporiaceae bacterium]|nr:hypothetical protein [Kineosporiaceae bacterium]